MVGRKSMNVYHRTRDPNIERTNIITIKPNTISPNGVLRQTRQQPQVSRLRFLVVCTFDFWP